MNYKIRKMRKNQDMLELEQLENGDSQDKIITLKAVFKSGKYTVQPARNPKTGWFHGVPRLSEDQKKTLKYFATPDSKIVLEDGFQINLNDEVDKANWEWLKVLPCIAASFELAQSQPSAMFYVYIPGREAKISNKRAEVRYEATKFIMEDAPENLEDRALLLGSDLEGESPSEIKKYLLGFAEKNPELIINIYKAKDISMRLTYVKAKKAGLIKTANGVIYYGDNALGVSDDSAVVFLQSKDHEGIYDLLVEELKGATTAKGKKYNFQK